MKPQLFLQKFRHHTDGTDQRGQNADWGVWTQACEQLQESRTSDPQWHAEGGQVKLQEP